jgi:hypothetical protein
MLALLVVYVLAWGPIECMSRHGMIPSPLLFALAVIYWPLQLLISGIAPLKDLEQWYTNLFP